MIQESVPRRHAPFVNDLGNLAGVVIGIVVGYQFKWPDFARSVATLAVLLQDRGDVFIVRELFGGGLGVVPLNRTTRRRYVLVFDR